jgi:RHS repeat-associated protein
MKTTRFEYTANQERAIRRDPDKTRYFVSGNYERVVTTGTTNTTEERFCLYAAGRKFGEIVRVGGNDETLYFHNDRQNSVSAVTTSDQSFYVQEFEPFGRPTDPGTFGVTRVGFTGHHHDNDLGLIDMNGRVYDPLAGRFMSADPAMPSPYAPQGLNRYAYVLNDPINYFDPNGFDAWEIGLPSIMVAAWLPGLTVAAVAATKAAGMFAGIGDTALNAARAAANGDFAGGGPGAPAKLDRWLPTKPSQTILRQRLIDYVVEKYGIDTSHVGAGVAEEKRSLFEDRPIYEQDMPRIYRGAAELDGRVFIGPEAFTSEEGLAATLAHESEVHANVQRLGGRLYFDEIGEHLKEAEAHGHILANPQRFNLPSFELNRIQGSYDRHLKAAVDAAEKLRPGLGAIYEARMKAGIFTLVK